VSENKQDVLAALVAFESVAFRIGQLARRLRTEHPDLSVQSMEPTAWVLVRAFDGPDVHAELEIRPDSVDDARAWAKALGTEATATVGTSSPYERVVAEAVIDGVMVKVDGMRALVGDEYAAWQAGHDQAAAKEPGQAPGGESR